jgi:WXG100 family type VII secretion target
MAETLKVSQQEIQSLASKIISKSSDASNFLSQIQKVVDETHSVWLGASSDKFHQEFSELRKDLQLKLDEYLKSLADALKEVARALQQADEDISKKIDLKAK